MVLSLPTSGSPTTMRIASISAIEVIVLSVLLSPAMRLTQEWLNRPSDVNLLSRKSAPSVSTFVCLLVGWLMLREKAVLKAGCSHRMLHRNVASDRIYTRAFCPCVHEWVIENMDYI
jgi:hypothetical protein